MTRITSTILIMMVLLNGTATVFEVSGLSDDLGIEYSTGVSETMDDVVQEMKKGFNPQVGVIESLISLAVAAITFFEVIVDAVFAAPDLMKNLLGRGEFVNTVVDVLAAPLYIIATLEIVFLAVGRDMV